MKTVLFAYFFGKTIPVRNTKVNLKNKANMKVTLI